MPPARQVFFGALGHEKTSVVLVVELVLDVETREVLVEELVLDEVLVVLGRVVLVLDVVVGLVVLVDVVVGLVVEVVVDPGALDVVVVLVVVVVVQFTPQHGRPGTLTRRTGGTMTEPVSTGALVRQSSSIAAVAVRWPATVSPVLAVR